VAKKAPEIDLSQTPANVTEPTDLPTAELGGKRYSLNPDNLPQPGDAVYMNPATGCIEPRKLEPITIVRRTEANANRLAQAHLLLDRLFRRAESDHLHGKVSWTLYFQDGQAVDSRYDDGGRIKSGEQIA